MEYKFIPTGNEFIALPCIREADASMIDFTFLHMGYKGMLDVRGTENEPLIKPEIRVGDEQIKLSNLQWNCEQDWIPTFHTATEKLGITGIILAPVQERGFIYQLTVTNLSMEELKPSVGFAGVWADTYHSVNEDKKIEGSKYVYPSGWNNSLVFDLRIGVPIFAYAPMFDQELNSSYELRENGTISYQFLKEFQLKPQERIIITSFWGIGFEEVSATTAAKEMLRQGFTQEWESTMKWLSIRHKTVGDEKLDRILNRNLFFNFFYASGLTLDTEELVLVTSRSPRYYVSAAYWDRDSLLWSFPAVLAIDPDHARSMLCYVYGRQIRNVGVHSRYIDGTVLEPGFELDELCAPVIALYQYIKKTKETAFLRKDFIEEGIEHILKLLSEKRNSSIALYETFLQPTDDMKLYPYLTYDNVLVWRVYQNLCEIHEGIWPAERIRSLQEESKAIETAIWENCVKEYEGRKIFAWSVDLNGKWDIYDEPPGSIRLFPYYGFCDWENQIYRNTVDIICRPEYPYSFHGCNIEEIGCPHAPHPWVLSIANGLLCHRKEKGRDMLLRMTMDHGIACESVDENTGESTTGDAFATCAGFLAYAILEAFGQKK